MINLILKIKHTDDLKFTYILRRKSPFSAFLPCSGATNKIKHDPARRSRTICKNETPF